MNTPLQSKINWTALGMALVGLASVFGVIPEEAKEHILEITAIVGPVLVATFRTWFTKK